MTADLAPTLSMTGAGKPPVPEPTEIGVGSTAAGVGVAVGVGLLDEHTLADASCVPSKTISTLPVFVFQPGEPTSNIGMETPLTSLLQALPPAKTLPCS
jgi:hypothetical protein